MNHVYTDRGFGNQEGTSFSTYSADNDDWNHLDYAEQHQRVIARFGRFPHRNLVLGRPSTSEEMDFLLEPGSRF